jgi:hypothetical protein
MPITPHNSQTNRFHLSLSFPSPVFFQEQTGTLEKKICQENSSLEVEAGAFPLETAEPRFAFFRLARGSPFMGNGALFLPLKPKTFANSTPLCVSAI